MVLTVFLTLLNAGASQALTKTESFFKGNNINFIIPYSPGGGFDLYGRMIIPSLEKYTGSAVVANNIPAKLFPNQKLLNEWRNNFEGIRYYDAELDATLFGAVDDVLEFTEGKLAPLDYKSTGSKVPTIYDRFQLQMDIYTFLLEKQGYKTVRKGCLAFYIVDKENGFDGKLPFRKEIHMIDTDPSYVQGVFKEAVELLRKDAPPAHNPDCQYGQWLKGISQI